MPDPTSEDSPVGVILAGHYRVERLLGRGGMGKVYLARHQTLPKSVAIKVLLKSQDPAAEARFQREAEVLCLIKHIHVVEVEHLDKMEDSTAYLVMEFLEGRTLAQELEGGPLSPERACRIAVQVLEGLEAIHQHLVAHRDLKPENIFLLNRNRQTDFVKIVDFGLAKPQPNLTGGEAPNKLTDTGMVVGTVYYMAPEQIEGKSDMDWRSDQYALGCILYEMLTGVTPFDGETRLAVLFKHLGEMPVRPGKRSPGVVVKPALEAVVMRAMEKDPTRRFVSLGEMEEALLACLPAEERPRRVSPARLLAYFGGAGLLVAMLLNLFLIIRGPNGPVPPNQPAAVDMAAPPIRIPPVTPPDMSNSSPQQKPNTLIVKKNRSRPSPAVNIEPVPEQ